MDFFKNCKTNLSAIDGFANIHCRVYTIITNENADSASHNLEEPVHTNVCLLQKLSVVLRGVGAYTAVDHKQQRLWLFGTSKLQLSKLPISVEGQTQFEASLGLLTTQSLKCEVKTADLLTNSINKSHLTSDNVISSNIVRNKGNGSILMNATDTSLTSVKGNDHAVSSNDIYRFLIEALVSSLTYHLVKEHLVLPLNFRTSSDVPSNHEAARNIQDQLHSVGSDLLLNDVSVELTACGTLLISVKRTSQPYLRLLQAPEPDVTDNSTTRPSLLVRAAPGGRIFHCVSGVSLRNTIVQNQSGQQSSMVESEDLGHFRGSTWRTQVVNWLAGVGVLLPTPHGSWKWILITTPPMVFDKPEITGQRNLRRGNLTLEWPASLCFEYNAGYGSRTLPVARNPLGKSAKEPGVEWFQTSSQEGFLDPLDFAFDFLTNDMIREAEIKLQHSQATDETGHGSPGHSASANDIPSTTAIYPTPPDGLPSGVTPGSSILEVNVVTVPKSRPPETHESRPPRKPYAYQPQKHDELVEADTQQDENATHDRFDDRDDDLFESNGITEADFNFFDEPEMDVNIPVRSLSLVRKSCNVQIGSHHNLNSPKEEEEEEEETIRSGESMQQKLVTRRTSSPESIHQVIERQSASEEDGTDKYRYQYHVSHSPKLLSTPPLNPQSILEDLNMQRNSLVLDQVSQDKNCDRAWNPVDFHLSISVSDRKYREQGRFAFKGGNQSTEHDQNSGLRGPDHDLRYALSPSDPRLYYKAPRGNLASYQNSHVSSQRQIRARSSASDEEQDANILASDDELSLQSSRKTSNPKRRKCLTLNAGEARRESAGSVQSTTDGKSKSYNAETKLALSTRKAETILAHLFVSNPADWSLIDFPWSRERLRDNLVNGLVNFVEIAQILTCQAATNTIQSFPISPEHCRASALSLLNEQEQTIIDTLRRSFTEESRLVQQSILSTTELRDRVQEMPLERTNAQAKSILRRLKTTESGSADSSLSFEKHIFSLPAPYICIQKTDALWEMLPSAFAFWEPLGLGPANGPKAVKAYCVYPYSQGIQASIRRFLNNMQSAWVSCRLGNHNAGSSIGGFDEGLVPVEAPEYVTHPAAMLATRKACENLGTLLGNETRDANHCNVVYLVNPFTHEAAVRGICACFYALLRAFDRCEPKSKEFGRRPVLQIVPMGMVASSDNMVLLDSQTTASLAREVYDRCPSETLTYEIDLPITSAASTILAEPTPRKYYFHLTAEPPSSLLHERACMNVGYCVSFDERWITVAWSDSVGKYQHKACYSNMNGMTVELILQEIWNSTLCYIKPRKVIWQILVAKVGALESLEKSMWQRIAATTPSSKFPISLVIISVNISPTLTIYPNTEADQNLPTPTNGPHNISATYSTPITTPQSQIFSPVPTPPAAQSLATVAAGLDIDADPTARLIDMVDESWGIILGRRLSISRSLIEYNPALASGYLMKRTGPGDLVPPVLMEVNIMDYIEPPDAEAGVEPKKQSNETARRRQAENLLKDVLIMYRALGLLAKLRGMEDAKSCTPWHLSAAIKAEGALRYCM